MLPIEFVVKEQPNYSKECWRPYFTVNWHEALAEHKDNSNRLTFSLGDFRALAILQYIPSVEILVFTLRRVLGIPPNGYSHKEYFASAREHLTKYPSGGYWNKNFPPKMRKFLFEAGARLPFIFRGFTHTGYTNLGLLVLYGVLEPIRDSEIVYQRVLRQKGEFQPIYQGVFLCIQAQTSMTKLVAEVKKLYRIHKKDFEHLPSVDIPTVSLNAYRTVILRARGETYQQIADQLPKAPSEDVLRKEAKTAVVQMEKFFFGKTWKTNS